METKPLTTTFTIGVHIRWNSETWQVSGKIITAVPPCSV